MKFKSWFTGVMVVAGVLAAVLVAGCSPTPPAVEQPSTPPAAEQPAAPPAAEQSADPSADMPDAGSSAADLTRTKCTMCHTYDRVEGAQKDAAGWAATVDRMVELGLVVTPDEKQAILDYLAGQGQ